MSKYVSTIMNANDNGSHSPLLHTISSNLVLGYPDTLFWTDFLLVNPSRFSRFVYRALQIFSLVFSGKEARVNENLRRIVSYRVQTN